MPKIPVFDPSQEVDHLWQELNSSIQGVLKSGRFIMGPNVALLETEIAAYMDSKYAISVNSGTDALVIGLRALGVGPGDEVITTTFTFFATSEAICQVGATPVFVDIDPDTYNLDVIQIESKITSKTKAIIPVHLYGQPCRMDVVCDLARRHNLFVLEDVAQAFGASYKGKKVGTLGHVGAFSFFPSKNLGAYGDGGIIVTDDESVANSARMLRTHGAKKKYFNECIGYNSRLDELQASILRVKLKHIDAWNENRRAIAKRYTCFLETQVGAIAPIEISDTHCVYHQYTIRLLNSQRDKVKLQLEKLGIGSMVYYPVPNHKLPYFKGLKNILPEAERAGVEVLSLPIWPFLDRTKQNYVIEGLSRVLGRGVKPQPLANH